MATTAPDLQGALERLSAEFTSSHPRSFAHHNAALARFPNAVTHDSRYTVPFNLSIDHAQGAYKWDLDGHRYIDFVTGHGSLILGHGHPAIVEAVTTQAARGTHLGGNHELELAWADAVCRIVPGAEMVRFTSSGTEAVMMAIRMARGYTGRTRVVQFAGHFHGWSDIAFGAAGSAGIPTSLRDIATVIQPEADTIEAELAKDDVAALIVETSHPSFFTQPDPAAFLQHLRDTTQQHGALLIVDEVVSGFRWAPGGAQEKYGVHGDLTTLAKILAGGLPGGAVTGRADLISMVSFDAAARGDRPKIGHPGTYNANPLSAAAGSTCLDIVGDPSVQRRADASAAALRAGMNAALRDANVPGCVYGDSSMFRITLGGSDLPPATDLRGPIAGLSIERETLVGPLGQALNVAMMQNGVALFGSRGIMSIAHEDADVQHTVQAFSNSLQAIGLA